MKSNQCFLNKILWDTFSRKSVSWFILDLVLLNTECSWEATGHVHRGVCSHQEFRVELLLVLSSKSQGKPAKPGHFTLVLEAQ